LPWWNQRAIVEFEIKRINAPILFISASQDEVWPSTLMCNRMMGKLEGNNFQYFYEHIELNGGHAEFTRNPGLILKFSKQHYPIKKPITLAKSNGRQVLYQK